MPNVSTTTTTVDRMVKRAELPRVLMQGTRGMRAAGEKYLPKEPAETAAAYNNRKNRSFLFGAFAKTVEDMSGKVFAKPVVLGNDVPEDIKQMCEDIDLAGQHLNVFARNAFFDALQSGITFLLVDMPQAVQTDRPLTVAQERAAGRRPYITLITLENLIGWKSKLVNGVESLVQVRIRECVTEDDGEWGETQVEQIRVLEPGKWSIWRKRANAPAAASDEYEQVESGVTSLPKITLVPFYTDRVSFMVGKPPLEKLAELNVEHWQAASDLRTITHVSNVPILFGSGFDTNDTIEIGASTMVRTSDPNAKLTYVTHDGAAIGISREMLRDLELRMQAMGLQLLIPTPNHTATGEVRDQIKENSPLTMMARGLQDALEQALSYMAEYMNLGADKGGSVQVNEEFGLTGPVDVTTLLNATNSGQLSRRTFWAELQRRHVLSDSFDAEAEQLRIDAENSYREPGLAAA